MYETFKRLESQDLSQREAEGLSLPPGPWKELLLMQVSPGPRIRETLGARWMRLNLSHDLVVRGKKLEPACFWIHETWSFSNHRNDWGRVGDAADRIVPVSRFFVRGFV